jgi:hypothetical protein
LNLVHPETGKKRILPKVSPLDKRFSWSPNGECLAYSKLREY